jgi:nitroimidazol reductase NimA-like FMN-containing flavoprotein (pyridoxamine 5'-phosphate oxidase superfamily)
MSKSPSPRSPVRLRRHPERGRHDREAVDAILDEALFCHIGFVVGTQPFVIPTIHARRVDTLYVHGSAASRMLRTLARGVHACVTVSILDGLVLARSAFNHSMNYRSVVVLGRGRLVTDADEMMRAFEAVTEHVAPGRWREVRWPTAREIKATAVLAFDLDEASAKIRTGPPKDDDDDLGWPVWAGVLPVAMTPLAPAPDPSLDDRMPVPSYLRAYRRPGSHRGP